MRRAERPDTLVLMLVDRKVMELDADLCSASTTSRALASLRTLTHNFPDSSIPGQLVDVFADAIEISGGSRER